MSPRKLFLALSLVFVLALAACSPSRAPESGSAASGAAGLVEDLRTAGASVETAGEVDQPFFNVKGQIIQVNGIDVQVFEYTDETAAAADAAQISPDGTSVGTSMMMWIEPPHFWASGQLIVLYVGSDAGIIEQISAVLGAPIGS